MLVHDLSPKFAVLSNVGPGLRRGREASPEGPDSAELVREVVPVVVGDVTEETNEIGLSHGLPVGYSRLK